MRAAVWLMPEHSMQIRLNQAIAAYARSRERPAFAAHLTLVAGADPGVISGNGLADLAARHPALLLEPDGALRTDRFSQSFAIRLRTTDALLALRRDALAMWRLAASDAFEPHVSLTYGEPTDLDQLEAIAGTLPGRIVFDTVCWSRYNHPFETDNEVSSLETGPRIPLATPPHRLTFL